MHIFGRKHRSASPTDLTTTGNLTPNPDLSRSQIKRATRTRKTFAFLAITILLFILLETGGTYNRSTIRDWYFIRIDVSNIIPASVPNFALINTIAQMLGLHDFYQIGLWGFCEGETALPAVRISS